MMSKSRFLVGFGIACLAFLAFGALGCSGSPSAAAKNTVKIVQTSPANGAGRGWR